MKRMFTKNEINEIAKEASGDVVEVSNITAIPTKVLNALKAGDTVVKLTGNMKHSYRVSYKEEGQGICLTYTDASISETVSYDYVGTSWVYNSTDITELGGSTGGGLEVINVSKGEASQMGEGYYDLTISEADKAKILVNPQNYVLAFTENHVGTAYAHLKGVMDTATMGTNEKVYGFTFLGSFPTIYDIQIFVGDMDMYYEASYRVAEPTD